MPTPIYTHEEIIRRLERARAISDRVKASIIARANQASREAGLGDLGCQLHNSLVSFESGKPWREVDYSKARLARRLIEKSYEPYRIVDNYYRRMVGLLPH